MKYNIQFTSGAESDIKRLGPDAQHALKAINELRESPLKGKPLKGSLRGVRSLGFAASGGQYRVAYYVLTDDAVCLVLMVGPREGFYKRVRRLRIRKFNK